jgi:putative SOS response-associated peptidase YedK
MCGRSSLTKTEKELEERFNATFYSEELERYNPLPSFNVAPTQMHPVIANNDPDHLRFFKWGLIPFWAKDQKIGSRLINARIETLAEKASFKNALKYRRCIVPFDGFYEWKKTKEGKQPYRITRLDQDIFCIAGLWESWKSPEGIKIHSFTLITMPPNKKVAHLHNRMPAMLLPEQEEIWLSDDIPTEDLINMIVPFPDSMISIYPVSKRVNNVRENDAELIKPVGKSL